MDSKGGEVRRLNIVYFLSRLDCVEQPHLIRVHHLPRNGVYLRDVKRWLADLRGKEMPEAFSWSYKRGFMADFVWQDLKDDDLITPFSDNEYVLKGSELIHDSGSCSFGETRVSIREENFNKAATKYKGLPNDENNEDPENKSETPSKTSSEKIEESPPFSSGRSTITEEDDSEKLKEKNSDSIEEKPEEEMNDKFKNRSSVYSNPSSSTSQSSSRKNKGTSSSMLRNLLGCGGVDPNDAVVVPMHRAGKTTSKISDNASKLCKVDRTRISMPNGVFERHWDDQSEFQQQQRRTSACWRSYNSGQELRKKKNDQEFTCPFPASAAYKPVGRPSCSQCGKTFRPEKLLAHMKSCRGMKSTANSSLSVCLLTN